MPFLKAVQFITSLMTFAAVLLGASVVRAQLRSDFRVFSDSFVSPSFEATQKTNFEFAGLQLQSEPNSKEPLRVDLQGAVAFGAPLLNYFNIRELYFQSSQNDTDTLYIGRKKNSWNDLDQRWNLGLWQPLFQWNPLSAEQQGLSGIFWQANRENYGITIFGSPLYLPNQGPSFEVANGAFEDGNPWFRRPPEAVRIFNETTAVDYTLEKPSESQVVFKTSYGAKLSLGSADGVSFQISSMYKPSNDLALGYAAYLDTNALRAKVNLKPQVFYHSVTGMDFSHRLGSFRYGVSAMVDRPDKNVDLDQAWTKPQFQQAQLVSPFVEWIRPSYILTLQSLSVHGGEVTETGPLANPQRTPLTMRYPFQEAVMASMENRFSFSGPKRLASKISYTLSEKNEFEFLQWQLRLRWSSVWTYFSQLEFVHAEDTTFDNQNKIAQYRNLDRFLVGVSYVF